MKSFLTLSLLFAPIVASAQAAPPAAPAISCQQGKQTAVSTCDPQKLAGIQMALQNAQSSVSGGVAKDVELAKTQLASAMAANGELGTSCTKAINECSSACQKEMGEAAAEMPMGMTKYELAMKNNQECTQGKPKQVKEESDKAQGDMSQLASLIPGILQALTGLMGNEEAEDYCATLTPEEKAKEVSCGGSLDVAADATGTTLVPGTHRQATGSLANNDSLAQGQVQQGAPAQSGMSPASAGGGMMGGFGGTGGGSGGGGSGKAAAGKDSGKDGAPVATSSFGGGGGSKSAGGGSASKAATGSGNPYSRISGEDDRLMQAAVDKAMSQRNPASEGTMGGVTGALSLDNFLKIEKRMQTERNQLSEL